jgi:arabinogalactan endo-1,4-beta-galactosidase
VVLLVLAGARCALGQQAAWVGVDSNYALAMAEDKKTWQAAGEKVDPYVLFAKAGCGYARIRLWVGDEGTNRLRYATETALRAQRAGLKPHVVIFLSEEWADLVKQPAPAAWKDLPLEKKAAAVEAYAEAVVRQLAKSGVECDTFAIGNEIDFGICGEFEQEWAHRVSVAYMREKIWPRMVPILLAAQRGVAKANPKARFVVHLAQWNNVDYCVAFFQAMKAAGVQLDELGLSYYPSSAEKAAQRPLKYLQTQVATLAETLHKPVLICETGYPAAAEFGGQFAAWNHAVDGYPLTEAGQARWIADLVALARGDANFAGAFYWSPEWYGGGLWDAFALFDAQGVARPGVESFQAGATTQPALPRKTSLRPTQAPAVAGKMHVYFGNLHSHTACSDGQGTPEEAFTYARDTAKLDFLAVTEHNHLLGGDHATPAQRAALYAGPDEAAVIPAANRLNKDGSFVALYGQEFSTMSKGNHVNVFDVPAVIEVPNGKFDELLNWMGQHKDTSGQMGVVEFNHPGLSWPFNAIGRLDYGRGSFGNDAGWVAQMGKVTSLIEVLNGEPLPNDAARRSPQIMEHHYRMYLAQGFHLAPTGNQDNHHKQWGTCTDSRTGILAEELTKPALLGALRARHVYASENKHLRVIVAANGHLCGDVLSAGGPLDVALHVDDTDAPEARYTIEALSGTIGGPLAKVVATADCPGNLGAGQFDAMDGLTLQDKGQFIYFRITQTSARGENRAWTAPLWLEPGAAGKN